MIATIETETEGRRVLSLLVEGREHERAGRASGAVRAFTACIEDAGADAATKAEAHRRLAAMHRRKRDMARARTHCRLSYETAMAVRDVLRAAEALNGEGLVELEEGSYEAARAAFARALAVGGKLPQLRAQVTQNLGVIANIQGDLDAARTHYRSSLRAFEALGSDAGAAVAHHNIGMVHADRRRWADAARHFDRAREIAESIDDVRLRALCLLNHTEVHVARRRWDLARDGAEEALAIFHDLGAVDGRSAANKVLGIVFRETGKLALAETRLLAALALAVEARSTLNEAEAARELARLYQKWERNADALRLLGRANAAFARLEARRDLTSIGVDVTHREGLYFETMRTWAQSLEAADRYTSGHSSRVTDYAALVGLALGFDNAAMNALLAGASLHDLGKVHVPHEILNKPGRLTDAEWEVVRQHPVRGVEMLADAGCPWDIAPMIRSHHEKYDGSGYPDRLRGDEIPLAAQVIGIADVYDALTTTRSYRAAMTHDEAMAEMALVRHWWRADVYEAFVRVIPNAGVAATTEMLAAA